MKFFTVEFLFETLRADLEDQSFQDEDTQLFIDLFISFSLRWMIKWIEMERKNFA